jgi:hypothetical protein
MANIDPTPGPFKVRRSQTMTQVVMGDEAVDASDEVKIRQGVVGFSKQGTRIGIGSESRRASPKAPAQVVSSFIEFDVDPNGKADGVWDSMVEFKADGTAIGHRGAQGLNIAKEEALKLMKKIDQLTDADTVSAQSLTNLAQQFHRAQTKR